MKALSELSQHAGGYCGEGATPGCFARMRQLIEEVTSTVSRIKEKTERCECIPGVYDCILHEAESILP